MVDEMKKLKAEVVGKDGDFAWLCLPLVETSREQALVFGGGGVKGFFLGLVGPVWCGYGCDVEWKDDVEYIAFIRLYYDDTWTN